MRKDNTPQAHDVVFAVNKLNKFKKDTPEYENAHKEAIRQVKIYNNFYGKDNSMSIRKARNLISVRYRQDKLKAEEKAIKEKSKKK